MKLEDPKGRSGSSPLADMRHVSIDQRFQEKHFESSSGELKLPKPERAE
jgi:hypothetical protein